MAALPGWGLSDLARGSISGAGARIGEKESLNRSGDSPSGSGALGETYGSAAPADENTSAGSGSGRSPRWSAPEPEPVSLRSSTRLSLFRAATVRLFKTTEAAVIGTRERAATAFTPIEEEGVFAMERRSSLGFEGLPEMPKGQGLQDEASVEWDTEARRWEEQDQPLEEVLRSSVSSAGGQRGWTGMGYREYRSLSLSRRRGNRSINSINKDVYLRAATFLEDALGYRDPDYYSDSKGIRSYRLRQSRAWRSCTAVAVLAYIAACFLGKPPFDANSSGMPTPSALQGRLGQMWGMGLECGCVLFFVCDIYLLVRCTGYRSFVTCWWKVAFAVSLLLSAVDVATRWYTQRPWSRLFRAAVFFYVGPKVRDCSISTLHAVGALVPVLVLELLVTLTYSCVCVVLYHDVSEATFTTLGDAFLSLFTLTTTVNGPDVWMPLYHRNRASVLVFYSFLVVQVFLLNNILLASVWNEFGQRMKTYARRKKRWREASVRRAFEALDFLELGYLSRDTVMTLLMKIKPHYDGSKRYMMYERIVHSVSRRKSGKHYDAAEVTQVNRRDFCDNVVEALSLRIRTMREHKIARAGQYMLFPLYVWNMAFVVVTCAMSPWVFTTRMFWAVLLPTSLLLGASVLAEIVMTGFRAYLVLPWNRVKTVSLVLTITGLLWFLLVTPHTELIEVFKATRSGTLRSVHIQVSIGLLMSARCLDLGSLLRLVPSIHEIVSIMYMITPSVFAQAGVIFTIFHVYAYLGMALYGGVITSGADYGDTPFANMPYYYDNNFNSYPAALVTLFELLIMNNWNVIITGYIHASPLGMWTYLYFLSFITLAVALALNVLTAIFMTAFTTTTIKANMPAVRGAGALSQSMTSDLARTALGAGASLSLRPSRGLYLSSVSGHGDSGDFSPPDSSEQRRSLGNRLNGLNNNQPDNADTESVRAHAGDNDHGEEERKTVRENQSASSPSLPDLLPSLRPRIKGGDVTTASPSTALPSPPPPPLPAVHRYPDPLRPAPVSRSRLSATAVLPEHEAVEKVGDDEGVDGPLGARVDMRNAMQDSYLGWGSSGLGENGMVPPPSPLPGSNANASTGRARWGSGHYYKVSRRNSYSDKDMFEEAIAGEEDEEGVVGKVLGAIAIGLGHSVGIRACMLRRKEPRASPKLRSGSQSSREDELEHPEAHVIFESKAFRQIVEPHLPREWSEGVLGGGEDMETRDEGWEAMAMRDELMDMMLHRAFGETIASEFTPPSESPGLGTSKNVKDELPPVDIERVSKVVSSSEEEDVEEDEDCDLPKDLGVRTWSKTLSKGERASRAGYKSKTAVMSIQCVLAIRKPAAVVVYTARVLQ